jgi:hypothetical protein
MLAVSLYIWHLTQPRAQMVPRDATISGALAGAAALMRWQDGILLAITVVVAVVALRATRDRVLAATGAVAAGVLVFAPQMAIWQALYGAPLAIPQGPSFMRWSDPALVAVLFSQQRGLFAWTPILLVAAFGLWTFGRIDRRWAAVVVVLAAVSWYVNAAVADWWAGEAFGARRFLSLFPMFVIGYALWLQPPGRQLAGWKLAVTLVLVALNALLLLQYQLFMKGLASIAPYPYGWFDFWVTRFLVPFRLAAAWVAGGVS